MPAVEARLPFDDRQPDGYLESLNDWYHHNEEAVEWFLENADAIRALVGGDGDSESNSGPQTHNDQAERP